MKWKIGELTPDERELVRGAVKAAVRYWPNAHLGDYTTREDIRSAFMRIRRDAPIVGFLAAVYRLEDDALAHQDM